MSIWDKIKEQVSIEDVISDYVTLKSKGVNFTCPCPFHREKTPSLIISPEKQIWHCFGCGAGGDVFAFVKMIENIDTADALKLLAKKSGLEDELKTNNFTQKQNSSDQNSQNTELDSGEIAKKDTTQNEKTKRQKGLEMLDWTADLYHKILLKKLQDPSDPITQYCLKRGLDRDTIKKFKIGYAPKNSIVSQTLASKGALLGLAEEIGIVKK